MAVGTVGALPNNLLNVTDQSFEAGVGNWTLSSNCSINQSGSIAFEGSHSLLMIATASTSGASIESSYQIPVTPGLPYVASCMHRSAVGAQAYLLLEWHDASGNYISNNGDEFVGLDSTNWYGLTVQGVAPSNAATVQVEVSVANPAAGGSYYFDMVYVSQSDTQVQIDWQSNSLQPSGTLLRLATDATPFVKMDEGISLTRGRQDNISEVQPGTLTFTLDNNTGWFTPDSDGSPYYPYIDLGAQVQVFRYSGQAWVSRFMGWTSELDFTIDPTTQTSKIDVTVNDLFTPLSNAPPLNSWAQEYIQTDSALQYFWPMTESPVQGSKHGMLTCQELTGNGNPLQATSRGSGTGASVTLGHSAGYESMANSTYLGYGPGPNSSAATNAYFTSTAMQQSASAGLGTAPSAGFQTKLPTALTVGGSAAWTAFCVMQWDQQGTASFDASTALSRWTNQNGPTATSMQFSAPASGVVLALGDSRTGKNIDIVFQPPNGPTNGYAWWPEGGPNLALFELPALASSGTNYSQVSSDTSAIWNPACGFMMAPDFLTSNGLSAGVQDGTPVPMWLSCSGQVITLYLLAWFNGLSGGPSLLNVGSITTTDITHLDTLAIGQAVGGGGGFSGGIGMVAIFNRAQNAADTYSGAQGMLSYVGCYAGYGNGTPSYQSNLINLLFRFCNLPSYLLGTVDQGLGLMDSFDLLGSNALTAMQAVEASEQSGLLFIDSNGKLNFHDRARRMGLEGTNYTIPEGVVDADLGLKLTTQYTYTQAAIAGSSGVQPGTAVSPKATRYGTIADGTPTEPTTVYLPEYNSLQPSPMYPVLNPLPDPYLQGAASWQTGRNGQALLKVSQLTIDLLTAADGMEYLYPFETGLMGWTISGGTIAQQSTHAHTGTYAAVMTVSGSPTQSYARSPRVATTPGDTVDIDFWVYATSALTGVQATINWEDATGAYLSSGNTVTISLAANTWTHITSTGSVVPSGAAFMSAGPTLQGSPANGTTLYFDDVTITDSMVNRFDIYALDINSTITIPNTVKLPDITQSLDFFIEGITESWSYQTDTIAFYTSPASVQRSWTPGDSTYGVLGQTTYIGLSDYSLRASDGSNTPVARQFDIQPGEPYAAKTISSTSNRTGFVGDLEVLGWTGNLNRAFNPPLVVAEGNGTTTTVAGTWAHVGYETTWCDTTGGMNAAQYGVYIVSVPGIYQISATHTFAMPTVNFNYGLRIRGFLQGQEAGNYTGTTPTSGNTFTLSEVDGQSAANPTIAPSIGLSCSQYLPVGALIYIEVYGSSALTLADGYFSMQFTGYSAVSD